MIEDQFRIAPSKLPSVEDAAADIRRLTAALATRREAALDNLVELAALAVDLERAAAVWRRLVPTGVWAEPRGGSLPRPAVRPAHSEHLLPLTRRNPDPAHIETVATGSPSDETAAQSPRTQR